MSAHRTKTRRSWAILRLCAGAIGLFAALGASRALGAIGPSGPTGAPAAAPAFRPLLGDLSRAGRARDAITEMDLPAATKILEGADLADGALAVEEARLLLFKGDYDASDALLRRPDLSATEEGAELGYIALGCARGMAATVQVSDAERGIDVRLQDDEDRALVPLLAEVAGAVRAQLLKDLGVELPRPLRIDLVRDQFTLAAMTGLPEEAARTTGTVAVAKWGRVTMVSPRATSRGYPWLDTLAHEMTHLALSRGTRDRAPLWLQEGVAKREETRWRPPQPLDDMPPIDAVAFAGMEKGLGRPIDKLGPSIAMLPTPEQAAVAFAEVQSFIRYWTKEVGDEGLPQLVLRLRDARTEADVDRAIQEVSGVDFASWDKKWRAYLAATPHDLPPELAPGANVPHVQEVVKRVRLGQLLDARGHHDGAAIELSRAQTLVPADASIRCYLGAALLGKGDREGAAPWVEKPEDIHGHFGRWWSLRGLLHPDKDAARSFSLGISLDPLDPSVACEEKARPDLPADPARAALCEAARRAPQ
ncbi:MAG: hypothetical protein U0359_08860 [Byssovorax sp.]